MYVHNTAVVLPWENEAFMCALLASEREHYGHLYTTCSLWPSNELLSVYKSLYLCLRIDSAARRGHWHARLSFQVVPTATNRHLDNIWSASTALQVQVVIRESTLGFPPIEEALDFSCTFRIIHTCNIIIKSKQTKVTPPNNIYIVGTCMKKIGYEPINVMWLA